MKAKWINIQEKDPVAKRKSGRFEICLWHWEKVIPQAESIRDLFAECEVDVHRACIRHSQWNRITKTWEETAIWCEIDELRSLAQALDELNCDA